MSKHVKNLISEYMDGGLKGRALAEFEAHIKTCGECGRALAGTRQAVKEAKKAKDLPLPVNFYVKLNKKLDAAGAAKESPGPGWNVFLRNAAIALTLLVVGVFVYNLKKQTNNFGGVMSKDESQMPQEQAAVKQQGEAENKGTVYLAAKKQKKAYAPAPAAAPDKNAVLKEEGGYKADESKRLVLRAVKPAAAGAGSAGKTADASEIAYESEISGNLPAAAPEAMQALSGEKTAPKISLHGRPQTFVYRNEKDWKASGENVNENIDFTKQMVVVVSLDGRPTAGFSVDITGVKYSLNKITVSYRENAPPAGALTAQVITYPYTYKIIDQSDLPVEFVEVK